MDPHWDPSKSSTAGILKCANSKDKSKSGSGSGKCLFSQSYSEASSWHAFKVHDKLWMGGKYVRTVEWNGAYVLYKYVAAPQTVNYYMPNPSSLS